MTPPRPATTGLLLVAALLVAMELIPSLFGPYGYFIDELYYVACSARPALGYVDHPPLAPWLLRASRAVLGDSLPALRVLPALAGGASVVLTGLVAWRLGAGAFGQVLAALALLAAPIPFLLFGFYSMNAFELLLWTAGAYVLVERARTGDGRLWLAFGAIAGVGLLNKHTFVLFGLGLLVGLVATRDRRELLSGWLWGGVALALLLVAPNLAWQAWHGWPSLEFYRNADLGKNLPTPRAEVLLQQVLFMNPAGALVWVAGLAFLLGSERARPWRHLGWVFAALFALQIALGKSRPDRLAPAYPIVLAAGGAAWDALAARRRAWRWALPVLLLACFAVFAPLAMPILPPAALAAYGARLGVVPQIEAGEGKRGELPQWMADRFGWEEFVDRVARVVEEELAPAERERALVLVPSYGHAGALELLGRGRGLPRVAATQNTYHLWGPGPDPPEVVVSLGYGPDTLGRIFEKVEEVDRTECRWCPPWRDGLPLYVARGPTVPLQEVWDRFKHYE